LTDGESCPVSHCYKPDEFVAYVQEYGFVGKFNRSAISLKELKVWEDVLMPLQIAD
jgi:hypothetical protein